MIDRFSGTFSLVTDQGLAGCEARFIFTPGEIDLLGPPAAFVLTASLSRLSALPQRVDAIGRPCPQSDDR
jgi:hypothetical protein